MAMCNQFVTSVPFKGLTLNVSLLGECTAFPNLTGFGGRFSPRRLREGRAWNDWKNIGDGKGKNETEGKGSRLAVSSQSQDRPLFLFNKESYAKICYIVLSW